jgi:hypothetical protein
MEKAYVPEKNPFHISMLVTERERPALRNHSDNTRSRADDLGAKGPVRSLSNMNARVACEENKTLWGRLRNSARLEKETKIEREKVEKRGKNCH